MAIGSNMRSASWADLENMECVSLIGMVVLVRVSYIDELGADAQDCFNDQDWTYGTDLND